MLIWFATAMRIGGCGGFATGAERPMCLRLTDTAAVAAAGFEVSTPAAVQPEIVSWNSAPEFCTAGPPQFVVQHSCHLATLLLLVLHPGCPCLHCATLRAYVARLHAWLAIPNEVSGHT